MAAALSSLPTSERTFPLQFGRFVLLEVLGEGGMGAVFRAEMEGPGGFSKACALKVMHPSVLVAAKRMSIDLRTEARLGALLHHPNIVETYDFGVEGGQPWISMELVDGTELSDILRGAGPLPAPALLELGIQLASGLEHAHRLVHKGEEVGFVHRDLKPSNVIISQAGLAKITDFGIATSALITGLTTGDGVTKGTPAYMAPEQAAGCSVDGRADLFALGAILYQSATGRRLFRGNSAAATMMAVLHVEQVWEQPGVRQAVEDVVPGLGRVLGWCLRRDPDDRYADATLVREALEELELSAAPGPGLRRWISDLPGRGTGYRGLRMGRRRLRAAAGAPQFDPRRDLKGAVPVGEGRAGPQALPEPPARTEPPPTPIAREMVSSPVVELPAAGRRPRLWLRVARSLAAAIVLGLGVGMGTVWLVEQLAVPEPAPTEVRIVAIAIEEAEEPGGPELEGVEPQSPAPGRGEVAALAGPPLARPSSERMVVHAGDAAVGEAGEAAAAAGEQGVELGAGVVGEVEVWVGDEVDAGTDVEPDAEGADPAPLVLIHPRPVRRVRPGQRPSFIVRSETGQISSGALLVRAGGGAWERHPLAPFSEGFWGTKVYVTAEMERGFDYYFEVDGGAGAVELWDGAGPYRVAVAR